MKILFISIIFALTSFLVRTPLYAAVISVDVSNAPDNKGEPFSLVVTIDTEGETISSLSGDILIPRGVVEVLGVSTRSSIVSLWLKQPSYSSIVREKDYDVIHFEGIVPGGYSGLRSAGFSGKKNGVIFAIPVHPLKAGLVSVSVRDARVREYSGEAKLLPTSVGSSMIIIPEQVFSSGYSRPVPVETVSETLTASILKSDLIANGKWYLSVGEDQTIKPIARTFIAESLEYDAHKLSEDEWLAMSPYYVLKHQSRNRYVHIKVVYENNSFTYKTLPPVENSSSNNHISIILIGIIVLTALLYRYGTTHPKYFSFLKKNS